MSSRSTSPVRTRTQATTRSGAQTPTSSTGVAPAAVARRLSAFDTLGTQPGRFTLVALLSGGEQGYFGLNPNAVKPYPAVP